MKKRLFALAVVCGLSVSAAPAQAYQVAPTFHEERTSIAVYHPDGRWTGSADATKPRPALSLAKLYLGYYVLYNGTDEEKKMVTDMVKVSSNSAATKLDRAYPEAIDQIAEDFSLADTKRNESWGKTTTSAYDMSRFIASILWDPKAKPLFDAMETAPAKAEDGFHQKFGTAKLDHATGFKTGWANEEDTATGSLAYGENDDEVWVATALTYGDAYDNTIDVTRGVVPNAKKSRTWMSLLQPWSFGGKVNTRLEKRAD